MNESESWPTWTIYDVYNCQTWQPQDSAPTMQLTLWASYWSLESAQLAMKIATRDPTASFWCVGKDLYPELPWRGQLSSDAGGDPLAFRISWTDKQGSGGSFFIKGRPIPAPPVYQLQHALATFEKRPTNSAKSAVEWSPQPVSITKGPYHPQLEAPLPEANPANGNAPSQYTSHTQTLQDASNLDTTKRGTETEAGTTAEPSQLSGQPKTAYIITETTQAHDHSARGNTRIYSREVYDDLLDANLAAAKIFRGDVLGEDALQGFQESQHTVGDNGERYCNGRQYHEENVASSTSEYCGDADLSKIPTTEMYRRIIQVETLKTNYKHAIRLANPTASPAGAEQAFPPSTCPDPSHPSVQGDKITLHRPEIFYGISETWASHDPDEFSPFRPVLQYATIFDDLKRANGCARQLFQEATSKRKLTCWSPKADANDWPVQVCALDGSREYNADSATKRYSGRYYDRKNYGQDSYLQRFDVMRIFPHYGPTTPPRKQALQPIPYAIGSNKRSNEAQKHEGEKRPRVSSGKTVDSNTRFR